MNSLLPLFLLPLTGGYWFARTWNHLKYQTERESGHALYFRAFYWGLVLVVCSAVAHYLLFHLQLYRNFFLPNLAAALGISNNAAAMSQIWSDSSRASVLIMSALFGPVGGILLNIGNLSEFSFMPAKLRNLAYEKKDIKS